MKIRTIIKNNKNLQNQIIISKDKMEKVTEIIIISNNQIIRSKVKTLRFHLQLIKRNSNKLNNLKILQAIKQNKNYKNIINK